MTTWEEIFESKLQRYEQLKRATASLDALMRRGTGIAPKDVADKQNEARDACAEAILFGLVAIFNELKRAR